MLDQRTQFKWPALELRPRCPVCGGMDSKVHLELDRFQIVRCSGCQFLYVENVLSDAANADYYDDYGGLRFQQGQRVNAKTSLPTIKALGDLRGRTLLDVGSGFGFFLAAARDLGMKVTGAELSRHERDYAEKTLGIEMFASLEQVPGDRIFDVVTLWEVIEHLRDPGAMIDMIAPLVRPGGFLVLGTDNFESKAVRTMGAGFPKWIPHQHISLFAPATLKRLATRSGAFKVYAESSFTPWEFWARIAVQKLSGGRKGKRSFKLEEEIKTEEGRPYHFFAIRNAVNSAWAMVARSRSLDGSMMHLTLQRV